jgi:uncharacterized damage-inducible protein DinB
VQASRDAVLDKVDGLSEYDARRPLTPTGTNLLGLVKHLAGVEMGYFGATFDRPVADPPHWLVDDTWDTDPMVDMLAGADESREDVVALYRRAWAHADATIAALPLDAAGHVAHWQPPRSQVTLHDMLVHVIAETARHAGHADIVREGLDGVTGLRAPGDNMPTEDAAWWSAHVARVEDSARRFR